MPGAELLEPMEFRYRGDAQRVELATFMPRFPTNLPLHRGAGEDWELTLQVPSTARIEYRFRIVRRNSSEEILDPSNPTVATNPFGENSVATGPAYRPPLWTGVDAPPGLVSDVRVLSRVFGGRRTHRVYRPAGIGDREPLPLLCVHDGSDYLAHAHLARAVDGLIRLGRIRPIRMVLLDPRDRHFEYVGEEAYASHLIDEVVPHVGRRFRVTTVGAMGASLGAVASLHAASLRPGRFDRLFLQSGTFALTPAPFLDDEMLRSIRRFMDRVTDDARLGGSRVFMTCGRYESLGAWNRTLAGALVRQQVDCVLRESWAGHDWGAWRDWFTDGLGHLYPPDESATAADELRAKRASG